MAVAQIHHLQLTDQVSLRVFEHEVQLPSRSVPCRTWVTDGLAAIGQTEVALTFKRRPEEENSAELESYFRTLHALAADGQTVTSQSFTKLRDPILGRHGVLYTEATGLGHLPLPSPCLSGHLVTREEVEFTMSVCAARVLTRLCDAEGMFPWPAWSDLDRDPVLLPNEGSVLEQGGVLAVEGARVFKQRDRVVLKLPFRARKLLRESLADFDPSAPLPMAGGYGPSSDACLLWQPGQQGPAAVVDTPRPFRVEGCFIVFIPGHENRGSVIHEDGFGVTLPDRAWERVRRGLVKGRNVSVKPRPRSAMGFELRWDPPRRKRQLRIHEVRLVQAEEEMAERIGREQLAEAIAHAHHAVEVATADDAPDRIEVTLSWDEEGVLEVESDDEAVSEVVVEAIPWIEIRDGCVEVHVVFTRKKKRS